MQDYVRLTPAHTFKPFDCGVHDLSSYLLEDAKGYTDNLLNVTYLIESEEITNAFFSLLNDKIAYDDIGAKMSQLGKNRRKTEATNSKRTRPSYIVVKIGRLGVCKLENGKGIGKDILNYIKIWFITDNKTGCRFITVDAYNES